MKKKITSVVLAMAMVACVCSTIRVEAAELVPTFSDGPVVISTIYTEKSDAYESGETLMAYYVVVEENVTTEMIADRLKITEEYLLSENDGRMLEMVGELPKYAYIALPEIYWGDIENVYYFVQYGDTLSEISEYFHISIRDIQKLNPQITDPDLIYAEDCIRIK